MQQTWDLLFKFHDEIQFSSNRIIERLKHCDSDSFYTSLFRQAAAEKNKEKNKNQDNKLTVGA